MSENTSNKNLAVKSANSNSNQGNSGSNSNGSSRLPKASYTPVETESPDIFKLLDELEGLPEKAQHLPFKLLFGFNQEQFYYLVLKIRANLPEDLKKAHRVARDSDRIVGEARDVADQQLESMRQEGNRMLEQAKEDSARFVEQAKSQATALIEHARAEQAAMIETNEIARMAESQAQEIIRHAEREAVSIRKGADGYACEVLLNLDEVMDKALGEVRRGREKLENAVK